MNDYEIRCPDMTDVPELKKLWKDVFGDSHECIDGFFSRYFRPEMTKIIRYLGKLAGMAYILPCGGYFYSGAINSCAMIYAVATAEKYRGRGFGTAVTDAARRQAEKMGFSAVTLVPAEPELFRFYDKLGFKTAFYIDEYTFTYAENCGVHLLPADAGEYGAVCERMLRGKNHIAVDLTALEHQKFLCRICGGDLALIEYGGETAGCICWEMDGEKALIKEYICPLDVKKTAGAISAGEYSVWSPGMKKPFAMAYGDVPPGYYGFAFG